jgi:hypothetical protein
MLGTTAADRAFERELLAAGRTEPLSCEQAEAAWAKFAAGLGTVASAAALSQLPGALAAGSVVDSVAAPGRWLERFAVAKWLLLGGLVGSALTVAWQEQRAKSESPPVAVVRPNPVLVVAPVAEQPSAAAPAPSTAGGAASHQRSASGAPSNAHRAAASASISPSVSLAAEVSALDAVRTAIGMGAWSDAQSLLSKYQRQFPKGALGAEAEVLAIEAFAGAGRSADAERAAKRFLARRPNDPQASRVRWLTRTPDIP